MATSFTPYPRTWQQGSILVESSIGLGMMHGDLDIEITDNGQVLIWVNGIPLIRFSPDPLPSPLPSDPGEVPDA